MRTMLVAAATMFARTARPAESMEMLGIIDELR